MTPTRNTASWSESSRRSRSRGWRSGSRIFLTPGAIAERLPHPGLILAVWVVGGLFSLAGALANAELGAAFPISAKRLDKQWDKVRS